jgi:predicted small secreted protein
MVRKVSSILMVAGALTIAACNTVRGAGADLQSAANCTENAINGGYC